MKELEVCLSGWAVVAGLYCGFYTMFSAFSGIYKDIKKWQKSAQWHKSR